MSKFNTSTLVTSIKSAFNERGKPQNIEGSKSLLEFERLDLHGFCVSSYSEFTLDILEEKYEALSWMSSEAFLFYLPWILRFSVEHNDIDNMSVASILSMLDRGTNRDIWDAFFVDRWTLLNIKELQAVEEWLLWVSERISGNSVDRAFDVIQILKDR